MTQPGLPGMEDTVQQYVGWFRAADGRSPWERVCSAPTERECRALLIAYKPVAVPRCEKCVVKEGVKP